MRARRASAALDHRAELGDLRDLSTGEQLLRALMSGPVAIAVSRLEDGAWLRVNDSFLLLAGYEARELVGAGAASVWADPTALARMTRALRRGVQLHGRELAIREKRGGTRAVLVTVDPLELGGEPCAVWTIVDITDRKHAEENQRRAEAELHRKSGLLAALNRAQASYLESSDARAALEGMLAELVLLTSSDFGAIYEVVRGDAGATWLHSCALSDLAISEDGMALMGRHREEGLRLAAAEALPVRVVASGAPVLVAGETAPLDVGGLPPEHPVVESFAGLPLVGAGAELLGVLCLANRRPGYDPEMVAWLAPALSACVSILQAQRTVQARQAMEWALHESEDRFRALVEGVRDYALVMLDPYGRFSSWNAGAAQITGLSEEETIGLHASCLYAEAAQQAGEAERDLAIAEAEGKRELEAWRVKKGGEAYWASVTITPLFDDAGRLRGFAQLMRDITHKKQLERLKDEFVSIVSHELRTPLTAIRGALGLLHGGALGEIGPIALEVVELARSNCERLVRLVSDILDIEKIEAGRMELKLMAVEPAALLARTLEGLRSWAADSQISLRLELGDARRWSADEDRTVQVLTNLVSNAIKFSPTGAEVLVQAAAAADGAARVEVIDQGGGIPLDKQHLLFGKFQQIDSTDRRKQGGTGLGLAITKAIVEMHGGKIGVSSTPGQGSCFWFELPTWKELS
jgi:PAS domain S-box-containing protein